MNKIKVSHFVLQRLYFDCNYYVLKISYTDDKIKNIQSLLKAFIICHKVAHTSMIVTDQYTKERKQENIFEQKEEFDFEESVENKRYHSVVILGWGYDEVSERYFWYIRDTNMDFFKKIAFSRYDNKNYWIGIDIQWSDLKLDIFSLESSINDEDYELLLKNGIFQKA